MVKQCIYKIKAFIQSNNTQLKNVMIRAQVAFIARVARATQPRK